VDNPAVRDRTGDCGGPYRDAVFTRPPDLPDALVADALGAGWGMQVADIEYAPVGYGSHHWHVAANDRRWFVTVDDLAARRTPGGATDQPLHRLTATLSTARALRHAGLEFVIAPLPTDAGGVVHMVEDRFAVALYPHVEGESHPWGPYPTRADRLAVLDLIAALHRAPETARSAARRDDLAIPGRGDLGAAVADLDRPWRTGPCGEHARALLNEHAGAVGAAMWRYDRLAADVMGSPDRMVLTHGEPHRANTITTTGGVVLIDWDTVLIAPPERDLSALADEDPRAADDYTARTGITPEVDAMALYRLWWDLTEVSIYIGEFHRPHLETEDTSIAWDSLNRHLDPARWQALT